MALKTKVFPWLPPASAQPLHWIGGLSNNRQSQRNKPGSQRIALESSNVLTS